MAKVFTIGVNITGTLSGILTVFNGLFNPLS